MATTSRTILMCRLSRPLKRMVDEAACRSARSLQAFVLEAVLAATEAAQRPAEAQTAGGLAAGNRQTRAGSPGPGGLVPPVQEGRARRAGLRWRREGVRAEASPAPPFPRAADPRASLVGQPPSCSAPGEPGKSPGLRAAPEVVR